MRSILTSDSCEQAVVGIDGVVGRMKVTYFLNEGFCMKEDQVLLEEVALAQHLVLSPVHLFGEILISQKEGSLTNVLPCPQHLAQCLTHSKCSMNVCEANK